MEEENEEIRIANFKFPILLYEWDSRIWMNDPEDDYIIKRTYVDIDGDSGEKEIFSYREVECGDTIEFEGEIYRFPLPKTSNHINILIDILKEEFE